MKFENYWNKRSKFQTSNSFHNFPDCGQWFGILNKFKAIIDRELVSITHNYEFWLIRKNPIILDALDQSRDFLAY